VVRVTDGHRAGASPNLLERIRPEQTPEGFGFHLLEQVVSDLEFMSRMSRPFALFAADRFRAVALMTQIAMIGTIELLAAKALAPGRGWNSESNSGPSSGPKTVIFAHFGAF
jgi:hypothetical protein